MARHLPRRGDRVEFRGHTGSREGKVLQVLVSGDHVSLVVEFEDDGELTTIRVRPSQIESFVHA